MIYWLLRPFNVLSDVLTSNDAPHQIGLGVALGMMAGLLPKDNLLAVSIATAIVCIRCNLASAGIAAFIFSWVGLVTDPVACLVGGVILEAPQLQPMLAAIYQLPLAAWTDFNNTSVTGNLLLGLLAAYPLYAGVFYLTDQHAVPMAGWLAKYRISRFVLIKDIISLLRVR